MSSPVDYIDYKNDDSINLDQANGYMRVQNFSYTYEPEQEVEVRKQINQYLKLKLKKQDKKSLHFSESKGTDNRQSNYSQTTSRVTDYWDLKTNSRNDAEKWFHETHISKKLESKTINEDNIDFDSKGKLFRIIL